MNSLEILRFLSSIPSHTVGVFPADKIPRVWTKPVAFVFNTQDNSLPGQHWVAVYVDRNGQGIFFDSYGLPPYVINHIRRMRKNCKQFVWNTTALQSESSNVCGQFCIMFLRYMSRGLKMRDFLNKFTTDLKLNDRIAAHYVNRLKRNARYKINHRNHAYSHSSEYFGKGISRGLRLQNCNCKTLPF